MKYILKAELNGSFPGSPDHYYVRLTPDEWETLQDQFKGRWKDTREQALEDE